MLAGLVGSYWANRFLAAQLQHVADLEPSAAAALALFLIAAILVAAILPALRATRVDPVQVLRLD